uniref:UBX domain-containing protein n=1 Tax=Arion vulgaris TaxID=1028688 RepID=A0A0B7A8P8_9EUPU
MSTLMSMGFEFNDCHEAIINGKLTVQAAIDWILSGKPGNVAATQPSLKLNKSQVSGSLQGSTSNPFVHGSALALKSNSPDVISSSKKMGVDVGDDAVVSRSHLSEKQQQIKVSFEEKERQEARRKVNEEKRQKKLERERILKEIQEDREKVKISKQLKTEPVSLQQSQSETSPLQEASTSGIPSHEQDSVNEKTTAIQVRLPSGQIYRHNFQVTATLNNVWDALYERIRAAMLLHSGFIQPFPRREFTKEEMNKSLQELGLVPSGSLVLKKKTVDQAGTVQEPTQPPVVMRALDDAERSRQEHDNGEGWDEMANPAEHQWGRGFRVEDGADINENEMGMDIDENGEENAAENNAAGALDQIPGLLQHPILGNQPVFQGFGQRLVPAGVPQDNNRHIIRGAATMAAEAAAQRSANPQPPGYPDPKPSQTELLYTVRSLQDLAMYALARRLTDPRIPIYSMSGLSEDLLQKFLTYLMKERLLKPKILHMIPSYLNRLTLDYYPYTTNELLYSARVFVHLQTLSLNSCSLITDSGLSSITGMKSLKILNLSGCSQITNSCFTVLSELPSLQTLSLEGTSVTDQSVIHFAGLGSCSNLQNLDLSRTSVTHEIFTHLQNFKKLRSLYLKQSKISSLVGLDSVVTLENLDISETCIVTDSILFLTRLPNLRHVSLTGTQDVHGDRALYFLTDMKLTALLLPSRSTTTDVGMAYISGFVLTILDLTNYTNVGNAGLVHIGNIVSLKKLLLTNTKISDEGMQYLAGLSNLEVLFVDRTYVSNAGASVVSNFKVLNELSLSETSITGDFLKQGTLNSCFNLTKLNMSKTIIGDKGIAYLKMPNLQYLNLDCTHVHQHALSIIEKNCPHLKNVTLVTLSSLMEVEEN